MVKKKEENKKKSYFKGKILKKPTAKVKKVDPKRFISSGLVKQKRTNGNRTGYIKEEMMEEKIGWLN